MEILMSRMRMRHRSRSLRLYALLALVSVTLACHSQVPEPAASPIGCYRFDRPVSYSAAGDRERGDSAWYIVELLPDGAVSRPYFQSGPGGMYAARSAWRLNADTLGLRVFDGLVGWDMTLLPTQSGYSGRGRYLSDARAVGREPPTAEFSAQRTSCSAAL
jgi:hypothetical protein